MEIILRAAAVNNRRAPLSSAMYCFNANIDMSCCAMRRSLAVYLVSAHWSVWLGNLLVWLLVSRHWCTRHRESLMALSHKLCQHLHNVPSILLSHAVLLTDQCQQARVCIVPDTIQIQSNTQQSIWSGLPIADEHMTQRQAFRLSIPHATH